MGETEDRSSLRSKGEEAIGELAQAMLENPVFNGAMTKAFGAGERAMSAQRSALGALNVASSSDLTRLEQRLRSLSGRLEAIEDSLDQIASDIAALRKQLANAPGISTDQERLAVADGD